MAKPGAPESLTELLKRVCDELQRRGVLFALAGGIAADLYRGAPRATDDLDFAVAIGAEELERGKEIIASLGFNPAVATSAMLQGDVRFRRKARQSTPQMIIGRNPNQPYGVDLMLLTIPWAARALDRAQSNLIKIEEIGALPCLTVEDMIISKLYAIKNSSVRRYKSSDIPDIALMFDNNSDVDLNYLSDVMSELELVLPKGVEQEVHHLLSRLSRKMRKRNRGVDY